MEDITIPEYFKEKTIFLTGGSGFIGMVMMEKLLRCCPDLKKIYILIRNKKNQIPQDRLKSILNNELYDTIRSSNPGLLDKVTPVAGDVKELQLGLNEEDKKLILESNIVFHIAASVRFEEPIKEAILTNTRATREIMELMLQMPNLEVGVHVSTTYSNLNLKTIEEKVYRMHGDWKRVIEFAENFEDDYKAACLTRKYLNGMVNTYVFTKHLAENIVEDYSDRLPLVIYRPGITGSTYQDPIPGWNDNLNGSVGLSIGIGKGFIRAAPIDPDHVADETPVDVLVRSMIIATWKKGTKQDTEKLPVYNCTMRDMMNYTYGNYRDNSIKLLHNYPFNGMLWYPFCYLTKNNTLYRLQFIIFNVLTALVYDKLLQIGGKKPMIHKLTKKTYIAINSLAPFALNDWHFSNCNFSSLNKYLKPADRQDFLVHLDGWEFYEFVKNNRIGASKYILKENIDFEKGKISFIRYKYLHYTLKYLIWASIFYFLILSKVL